MPAAKPTYVIEESGHFVPDGELDLIRIPPGSVEAYHFELTRVQRFRFAVAASSVITVRLADDRGDSEDSVCTTQRLSASISTTSRFGHPEPGASSLS